MTDLEEVREMYQANPKLFWTNDADGAMLYLGQLPRLFNYFAPYKLKPGLYLFDPKNTAIIKGESDYDVEWF